MTNIRFPLHRPQLREVLIRGEATIREAMGPPARHRKGDVLINTGEDSRTVYLLDAGWIARTRLIEDGRRQVSSWFSCPAI
jgi:CRP-like cAMP-binding protein